MTGAGRPCLTLALIMLTFACACRPARAALTLCDRTSYILYAATGTTTGDDIVTAGWIRLVPGGCATAIEGPLTAKSYYVYARSSQSYSGPTRAWGGDFDLCTQTIDFHLTTPLGVPRCSQDSFAAPFAQVDTKGRRDWTMTFTQSPPLTSATAARQAGFVRLLRDAGYHVGADAAPALDKFRARMRMSDLASADDLFDALETEALKVAAPAGFSICNDTNAPVWAALGFRRGKDWVSRGWWKAEPGACARAIAARLDTDRVYLLVERDDGTKLVTGPQTFCVTNIEFEIERRTDCTARGLIASGFAVTDTRGRSGYAAHISENGLLPAPQGRD